MKATLRRILAGSALFCAAATATGCAMLGLGDRQPSVLVATVQSVQEDFRLAQLQTAAATAALNELVVSDVVDLGLAYREFSDRVDRLEATGERLVVHADEMRYSGPPYLVESGLSPTECVFPRRRLPQDSLQADLGPHFYAVAEEAWKVKRAYRAYHFDVAQIRESLSSDLTPRGVEAMEQFVRKAKVDGESLREALLRAETAMQHARTAAGLLPVPPS